MSLPYLELRGDPLDQGRQHGAALRDRIAHNLEVYYNRFEREGKLSRDEVRRRALQLRPRFESHPFASAMQGVASGSGHDLVDILGLNLRYELLYYQYSVLPVGNADGCTSFGLLPEATAEGHLLIGQTWDWIPQVQGAVLHTFEPSGLEVLAFTEAGIVGSKIGLNSAGVGLCINGLLSTADDWSRPGLPFHVRCYDILRSNSISAAAAVVNAHPRACSANFLLAQAPGQLLDVEAAPEALCALRPQQAVLAHTNHFVQPAELGVEEPRSERRPHSHSRLTRIRSMLYDSRGLSVKQLQGLLRDHDGYPDSVCRHEHPDDPPEEACTTVTAAVMDLDARTLWLTDGPPCQHPFERFELGMRPR